MSTAAALEFSAAPYRHQVWRFVESQAAAATIRITDSLDEQARLEQLLDHSKPAWPAACAGLHYLLATPFRYAPYPKGSRFRAAGQRDGAFYASEEIDTAAAEAAFYLALFYAEAPSAQRPRAPVERTAFAVALTSARALDLTLPAFDARRAGPGRSRPCRRHRIVALSLGARRRPQCRGAVTRRLRRAGAQRRPDLASVPARRSGPGLVRESPPPAAIRPGRLGGRG
jgi:hypothetical protein